MSAFVCLDFSDAPGAPRHTCTGAFREIIIARELAEVPASLQALDDALSAGLEVIGWLAYEAAPAFDPAMRTRAPDPRLPLLWFGVDGREMERPESQGGCRLAAWQTSIDLPRYRQSFERIQQHIHDGDTYQINYTFPLRSKFSGSPGALYEQLRRAQSAAWAAWIHTEEWDIVSASPELFFTRHGSRLMTRPMKGTRRRGRTVAEDRELATDLARDPKDRAENVMIVDLLRNDMGRIASMGSVRPTALFTVEKYPTVWQMTSTVEAELPAGTSLQRILRGLFPCGSITGAPKVKTMEIIAREEESPRGVYCGSIGYARGDQAAFNVAIRTTTLIGDEAIYPVGSGLVADSRCEAEYTECLDKARVLERAAIPRFELLETLAWKPDEGFLLLQRHLQRLTESAHYFDVPLEPGAVTEALQNAVTGATQPQRVRLLVALNGQMRVESSYLAAMATRPMRVTLAHQPVDVADPFLYHKTTHRRVYDAARKAMPEGIDDVVLFTYDGYLTETTIANLALDDGHGRWVTPPVSSGLLAGTQRAELLASGVWEEGALHRDELTPGCRLRLANSVRGLYDAVYVPPGEG